MNNGTIFICTRKNYGHYKGRKRVFLVVKIAYPIPLLGYIKTAIYSMKGIICTKNTLPPDREGCL